MPKRAKGLTAAFCNTVKAPGKYNDGDGLMLIVTASGSKRWGQRLMIRGSRRDLGLGAYSLLSLAEARGLATENRRIARAGGDPIDERRREQSIPTFKEVAALVIEKKRGELKNSKHLSQWESTLEEYAFPRLGNMQVSEVSVEDVLAVIEPIWKSKAETASRVRGRIEAVMAFATVRKWRSGPNPATWPGNLDMLLPKRSKASTVVHQPTLPVSDAPKWFYGVLRKTGVSARALEYLTLTWARSGEVRGATWSEIDLEKAVWTIPASRAKTSIEHTVPLSKAAIALLRNLPRQTHSEWVFTAPRGGQLSDMSLTLVMRRLHASKATDELECGDAEREEDAGWRDPQSRRVAVPHGLRALGRNWAALEGYPRELAELALGHRIGNSVEQAYFRDRLTERRREMMESWAKFLHSETRDQHETPSAFRVVG